MVVLWVTVGKKKQCGIVKWIGRVRDTFGFSPNSNRTSCLPKYIIILINILFFSNEPHLNASATVFSSSHSKPIRYKFWRKRGKNEKKARSRKSAWCNTEILNLTKSISNMDSLRKEPIKTNPEKQSMQNNLIQLQKVKSVKFSVENFPDAVLSSQWWVKSLGELQFFFAKMSMKNGELNHIPFRFDSDTRDCIAKM